MSDLDRYLESLGIRGVKARQVLNLITVGAEVVLAEDKARGRIDCTIARPFNVDVYTSYSLYRKYPNTAFAVVAAVGSGGGGGGGAATADEDDPAGGGGGGGGARVVEVIPGHLIPDVVRVVAGGGGSGGIGTSIIGTGGDGADGSDAAFGALVRAAGGVGGGGGNGGVGGAGGAGGAGQFPGGAGATGDTGAGTPFAGSTASGGGGGGGGVGIVGASASAGGGVSTTVRAGGAGAGGILGGALPTAGESLAREQACGGGGGGGGAGDQDGASGGNYGGGGGGGGANHASAGGSSRGGAGGQGVVVVITRTTVEKPVFVSARLSDDRTAIVVTFSSAILNTFTDYGAFALTGFDSAGFSGVGAFTTNSFELTLLDPDSDPGGAEVWIEYTRPATGGVRDALGHEAPSFGRNRVAWEAVITQGYIIDWNAETPFASTNYPGGSTIVPGSGTIITATNHGSNALLRTDWGDGSLAFRNKAAGPITPYVNNGWNNAAAPAGSDRNAYTIISIARMSADQNAGGTGASLFQGSASDPSFKYFGGALVLRVNTTSLPCPEATIPEGTPFVFACRIRTSAALVAPNTHDAVLRRRGTADLIWGGTVAMSAQTGMIFGGLGLTGAAAWHERYKRLIYWPRILTDAELVSSLDFCLAEYLESVS